MREIRSQWDEWDLRDGNTDDLLDFNSFYNGFMAPYFGCYRCDETRKALKAIDMDNDGSVDWNEFAVYLKWAGHQYPKTETAQELLEIAFRKGLLPAMQDELINLTQHQNETAAEEQQDPEDVGGPETSYIARGSLNSLKAGATLPQSRPNRTEQGAITSWFRKMARSFCQ